MKRLFFFPLLLVFAGPVLAEQQTSFIYIKTILKIVPKPEEPTPIPAEKDKKDDSTPVLADEFLPKLKRVTKEFTVEVRNRAFLEQTDFISHQPFADKEGMLILVDPPAKAQVRATRMIASADVLFVNQDGIIVKIAPDLQLSDLSEPIDSGKPIKAFVYLKAGTAASADIQLGDRIENSVFKTHPVVLQ